MGTWKKAKQTVEDARREIEEGRAGDELAKKRAEKEQGK
jgi:hypothetical protein